MKGQDIQFVRFAAEDIQITQQAQHTTISLCFDILDGYHIQSNRVENENLLATKIELEQSPYFEVITKTFSTETTKISLIEEEELSVFSNTLQVEIQLQRKRAFQTNDPIKGTIFYQTCDKRKCYFPRELAFSVPIR